MKSKSKPSSGDPAPPDSIQTRQAEWKKQWRKTGGAKTEVFNRSGIPVQPLYTPADWDGSRFSGQLGFPGEEPYTRGIYPTMHRGRPWSRRQLVGLGTPSESNFRQRMLLENGATAVQIGPCNIQFRGYDYDEVDPELMGICGSSLSSLEDLDEYLHQIPLGEVSIGNNDCIPFTLAAQLLVLAKRRGVPWKKLSGTSNQSDYLSHYIANHMFFRLSLPGSRRVSLDHIEFMNEHVPRWYPISVVGQHMQQAGATPAQAMAFTLSTAIQYAGDCLERGMEADRFLPRFSFFFDISVSFFEEVAKLRAGRRLWARITRERFGAKDPRSHRLRFHGQTSGADLTAQQPLNNVVRVAVQAMAGIFGGLQSLHTDSYDEALSTPTEEAARIAINTQNILHDEAHLDQVIDPLGGSYYVESLTDRMEEEIEDTIRKIDEAGGMFEAAQSGLVQEMIGRSALEFQKRVESGEERIVGVNAYQSKDGAAAIKPLPRPDLAVNHAQIDRLKAYKNSRDQRAMGKAMRRLARAANSPQQNIFAEIIAATEAGATHGEIVACLREELGFGQPRIAI
ncbi:MAG: acyl-CoA mutase large subunit family protein [bacterium]